MELILIFLIWFVLGAATAYIANIRGRDPFLWPMGVLTLSLIGLPFAVIGIAILYFLPTVEENEEDIPENREFAGILPAEDLNLTFASLISSEWFYYDQLKERHGPVSFKEFQFAWKSGDLDKNSFVWMEGMEAWVKIDSVSGLQNLLESYDNKENKSAENS